VKGEYIVALMKLGMGVNGTLDKSIVVTEDVDDIVDRDTNLQI
jgi:hypothetical protein